MAPQLAPQLVGKITFLEPPQSGGGARNSIASVASYLALTFFLKKVSDVDAFCFKLNFINSNAVLCFRKKRMRLSEY